MNAAAATDAGYSRPTQSARLRPSEAPVPRRPVPHAAHFLERLDRVPRSLTDFALGLYRDESRVRWIIRFARLPEGERRVAFALGTSGAGPYIVVTREGKFVTALGAEMRPKNLTILSRGQVDKLSARFDEARARFELALEIVPPGKHPMDILGLLDRRSPSISREEFSAISAWAPLLATQFLRDVYERVLELDPIRCTYLVVRDKSYRNDPRTRLALDRVWNGTHGMGTRFALAATSDLAWAPPWAQSWSAPYGPTFFATDERVHSVAMRGAWAAARMGKHFFPVYKKILSTPGNVFHRFDAALAMTAVGIRHARFRDDARRAIEGMVATAEASHLAWVKAMVAASARAFDDPEGSLADVAAHGAKQLVSWSGSFPDGSPYKATKPEDVSRETALLVAANAVHDSLLPHAFYSLAWVAKLASAEELFYPDEVLRALRFAWTPAVVESIYDRKRAAKPKQATREGPKLGRNEACSCGSGKKNKRCCAR